MKPCLQPTCSCRYVSLLLTKPMWLLVWAWLRLPSWRHSPRTACRTLVTHHTTIAAVTVRISATFSCQTTWALFVAAVLRANCAPCWVPALLTYHHYHTVGERRGRAHTRAHHTHTPENAHLLRACMRYAWVYMDLLHHNGVSARLHRTVLVRYDAL